MMYVNSLLSVHFILNFNRWSTCLYYYHDYYIMNIHELYCIFMSFLVFWWKTCTDKKIFYKNYGETIFFRQNFFFWQNFFCFFDETCASFKAWAVILMTQISHDNSTISYTTHSIKFLEWTHLNTWIPHQGINSFECRHFWSEKGALNYF